MIIIISPDGSAIGMARKMRKEARKNVYLFAPTYKETNLAGVTNIAGGKTIAAAFNDLYQTLKTRNIEYVVIDMIEHLNKPVLFNGTPIKTYGALAEIIHGMGIRGIGVFPFGQAMENIEFNRQDGADVAAAVGLSVPETRRFTSITDGIRFLQAAENRKRVWVFKPNDNRFESYVPETNSELIFFLTSIMKECGDNFDYILQEKIEGIEVDIEGWFCDGEYVLGSTNITLETKTFMTGNMGIVVGCATTVQKAISEESYLFKKALKPYFPLLKRWQYTGAFSVTTIVDDKKNIWYLENCVRMGWDASYALMELFEGTPHDFFMSILTKTPLHLKRGWGYGVRVTVPPYPLTGKTPETKEALKLLSRELLNNLYAYGEEKASKYATVWWLDVEETDMKVDNEVVFRVIDTNPLVITSYHETSPFQAEKLAVKALDAIVLPNAQARIGDGAYSAYQRFMSLVDRNIIITEERKRIKDFKIDEVLGDEKTATD